MTQAPTRELAALLTPAPAQISVASENALWVGAATLLRASADMVSSTTVVVDIEPDNLDALRGVAGEIAAASDLEVAFRPHVGWCAVRFCRRGLASG
jgi:hypothetical protein